MKVRFVQLESEAFLADIDFMQMSAAERGVYVTLLFYLYCSGGKCDLDPQRLGRLCNCDDFENIWQKICKKFQTREGVIKHKRVTQELRKARHFIQHQHKAGLAGASKRWQGHSAANGTANSGDIANETKGNVNEKERKDITNTNSYKLAPSFSNSVRPEQSRGTEAAKSVSISTAILRQAQSSELLTEDGEQTCLERSRESRTTGASQVQGLYFNEHLTNIIRPRSQSDRTCFRNVTNFLTRGCAEGRFEPEIFARVLDLAQEAKTGRKPAAVFMALLKKELGYRNETVR